MAYKNNYYVDMVSRKTKRKLIINSLMKTKYSGGPVLLEELRWNALLLENNSISRNHIEMSRSYRNSFSRTIREYTSDIFIQKLPRPDAIFSGIVSRAALYRFKRWKQVVEFLSGNNPTVFARAVKAFDKTGKARVYCKLFSNYPTKLNFNFELGYLMMDEVIEEEYWPTRKVYYWDKKYFLGTIILPTSKPLSLVTNKAIGVKHLKNIANIKWKIYRDPYSHLDRKPKLLRNNESIRSHWKGGYLRNPLSRGSWSITN